MFVVPNRLQFIHLFSWFMCSFVQEIKALLALRGKKFQPIENFKEKVRKTNVTILILVFFFFFFEDLKAATSRGFYPLDHISPQSLLFMPLLSSLLSGVWMVCLRRMSAASWPDLFVQSKCFGFHPSYSVTLFCNSCCFILSGLLLNYGATDKHTVNSEHPSWTTR